MSDTTVTNTTSKMEEDVHFTTLGMFIIDEIHYGPANNRKVATDVSGGGGTYALLGARLFSPPPLSRTLHFIVDRGHDFPDSCLSTLNSFSASLHLRDDPTRATTRGWNSYSPTDPSGHREFRYTNPKKRIEVADLKSFGLERTKSLHVICSPSRCIQICSELRDSVGCIVWEPIPDLCTPANREEMLKACSLVDVISPNEGELSGFFDGARGAEQQACVLLKAGARRGVVVRAGGRGCYVLTRSGGAWLPAYWEADVEGRNHGRVMDPTGGGNTFLGALCVEMGRGNREENLVRAAARGNVAASFAVEQIGLPGLQKGPAGERWNGVEVGGRWREYVERVRGRGVDIEV